jgi:hypothetical protein
MSSSFDDDSLDGYDGLSRPLTLILISTSEIDHENLSTTALLINLLP